ncbi:amidase [Actinoallomurus sp. NPDC050550]|uniref:amidase n=1 Tax=Actinoallomurus sp. NPDC050550 TaxID=3154937 RepID=UPI0033D2C086
MIEGLTKDAARLAAGEVSSRELVEYSLERIERDTLGAFRVVCADQALDDADRADRWRGEERPALLGVPVAIKDDTDLAGHITPFGCRGRHEPKTADSEVVRKLRAAGAIIVGKTNTSELGQWPTGETIGFGIVRNPWDSERTPGGSSAGSSAAVAAGLISGAVGSDGAGSLRIPAAWTGLVGLKPQRGRVSVWPHVDPFYGIAVAGPLTRTVEDAALLLDVLTGNHPDDVYRPPAPAEPYREAAAREPGRLRIAVSFRSPFGVPSAVDPEIRAAVLRLAGVLADLGHDVFPADPDYGLIGLAFLPRGTAGVADWLDATPDADPEPATRTEALLGRHIGRRLVPASRRAEPRMGRRIGKIFQRADVVLTPATAQLPLRIGALSGRGWWATGKLAAAACPFCWAWNVLGWPAIGVPAGLSTTGLPIGAQFLGRENDEATLLSLAAQLEAAERWPDRRPAEAPSSVGGLA